MMMMMIRQSNHSLYEQHKIIEIGAQHLFVSTSVFLQTPIHDEDDLKSHRMNMLSRAVESTNQS